MRPLRNKDPEAYHLVTIRTQGARLWITPNAKVKRLIGGILARYQEYLGIEIYAYCVLGNHLHMVVRAPRGNLDEFCENVNREIAKRLNWWHKREGKFWARRYDAQEILSEDDLLEAFLYVSTNPTRHGLLRDSSKWPGLNSIKQSLSGTSKRYSFRLHSSIEPVSTSHRLKLSVLPQFKTMTSKARKVKILTLLRERMDEIALSRSEAGEGFLGLESILSQEPGTTPRTVSRSKRPPCYTKDRALLKEFREQARLLRKSYDEASARYRMGEYEVEFPLHTFRPPTHRVPRLVPFQPVLSVIS